MPFDTEVINFDLDLKNNSSFDDIGITGYINSFVLEKGKYKIFIGNSSTNLDELYTFELTETILVEKCNEACAPIVPFTRIVNKNGLKYENVPTKTINLKEKILNNLPRKLIGKKGNFIDVINKKISLDEFVGNLDEDELEALCRGSLYSMNSPYGPEGNAATLGACNDRLFSRGIKALSTNDGPSGVRLKATATLLPNGVTMASSFNDKLIEDIAYELGLEVKERDSHILLAPGLNIHRHPLCGRNFEYFSEDPYLTGKIAISYVKGVQKANVSATPKHFACNNQESYRHINDSIVSQRALREIYLKAFEMCVKAANPDVLMTSYNKVNSIYSYYNYELINIILRKEWGYENLIITDWWMQYGRSDIFKNIEKQSYRVRAGVDVYMPGASEIGVIDDTLLDSLHSDDGITKAEIQMCAKRVLKLCLKYMVNDYD